MPKNASLVKIAEIASSAAVTAAVTTTPVRTDERGIGSERFGGGKRAILEVARGMSDVAGTMAGSLGTIAVYGADLPSGFGAPASPVLGNAYAASSNPNVQMFSGDGTTTVFQTNIPFAAFSNYNWIVETLSFKLTGTVTVAAGVVTGSSTNFDPEIDVGDELILGGKLCVVTARTSDTAAVVSPAINVDAGASGYNVSQNKRIKTYNDTEGTNPLLYAVDDVGGYAAIDFGVAPPSAGPSAAVGAQAANVAVYFVTPTEILASGTNTNVKTGIRSRTMMWTVYDGDSGDDFNATSVTLTDGV